MEHEDRAYKKTYWIAKLEKPSFPRNKTVTLFSEKNDTNFNERIRELENRCYRVIVATEIENDHQAKLLSFSSARR